MPGKSVPISVRISDEDASFLAGLEVPGAITPSEKVRVLISNARRIRSGEIDYAGSVQAFSELLSPVERAVVIAEQETGVHSELVAVVLRWLPEMQSFLGDTGRHVRSDPGTESLSRIEAGIADRGFGLFDHVLRLGVTVENPCYEKTAVTRRAGLVSRLFTLVESASKELKQ